MVVSREKFLYLFTGFWNDDEIDDLILSDQGEVQIVSSFKERVNTLRSPNRSSVDVRHNVA